MTDASPDSLDIRDLAAELGGPGVPVRWEEMSWPQIPALVEHHRAVIIPIGAIEQHGPHLPMNVDTEIDMAVAEAVSAVTGIPTIPPVSVGVSASHGDFAGTLTLRPETLIAIMEDLTDSLYRSGVRQFIFMSGHMWNIGALDVSLEKLRTRYDDVRARSIGYVSMYPGPEVDGHVQYGRGLMHANFFETSVMLHLRPELVDMSRATSHLDVDSFWDYRMDQVSDSGVWGRDVEQASAEHGRDEFERCVVRTARALAAAIREPQPEPTR
ncbi:creatininase family protein [Demequina aestuarii]|uniref:creatininase family protein n=1 Tax=Demequina aestuarii TaxID=327095 RepID=UPI000782A534|nr:creatininase family protein [Demequina aestuarii]